MLSGAGRLVVKDFIMLGAAMVTMADSAQAALRKAQATARANSQHQAEAAKQYEMCAV